MIGRRSQNAHLQSDFYRQSYRKLVKWLFITLAIIFVLLSVIIYLILFQPNRHYYANTVDGKIIDMPNATLGT